MLALGAPSAFAAFHGIGVGKTCVSPVKVGAAYTCQLQILNVVDTAHDTLRLTGFTDQVNAAGGAVQSGNLMPSTGLVFNGAVTCTGGSGAGTSANPYIGATECLLPFATSIQTKQFSHYTIQADDFNIPTVTSLAASAAVGATNVKLNQTSMLAGQQLIIDPLGAHPETRTATTVGTPGSGGTGVSFAAPLAFAHSSGVRVEMYAHRLTDSLQWNWNNTCTFDPDDDCTTNAQTATAGASTLVQKLNSSTTTDIHDGGGNTVTALEAGATVHDFVTVNGQPGSPPPSGTVSLAWFTNGTCAGAAAATKNETLSGGTVDATDFPQGPLAAGKYAFQASYLGDATYNSSVGACEPLTIVDANISLDPLSATNEINHAHTFTAHVNVNDGNGFAPANGALVTFSVDSGAGTLSNGNVSSTSCTTNASGNCTIDLNSSVAGVTQISGHTTVLVAGVSLTRNTDSTGTNSGPATKTFVDANISLNPLSATNEVNHGHLFTAHVNVNTGSGGYVNAPANTHVTFLVTSGAGTLSASSCDTVGTTGECSVTLNSSTPGQNTLQASTTLLVGGVSLTRTTGDSNVGDSDNATKTFVDANIAITPQNKDNPVGTNHTFTVTVLKDPGTGFVPASGEHVTFNIVNSGGATATVNTVLSTCDDLGPNTDSNGQCTIVISSPTSGTTKAFADVTLTVGGVSLHRDANSTTLGVGHGPGGTDEATKTWINTASNTSTNQEYIPQDSATVTGFGTPTGNVTFELYKDSSNCTGTPVYSETKSLSSGSASTNNSGIPASNGYTATGNHTWYWKVSYAGDGNNNPSSSCVESSQIQE